MALTIRKATRQDAPTILALVRALAEYERAADQVQARLEDVERDGFGEHPFFECLLAERHAQAVGMALYFFTWSTWTGRPTLYLEDLFVLPEQRGGGIGGALLAACAAIAARKGCPRFEWAVLDWNQPARDFYHRLGAYHKEDWLPYRLEGTALAELARSSIYRSEE